MKTNTIRALFTALCMSLIVACNQDAPIPLHEIQKGTKFRDLSFEDVPIVVNALSTSLGFSSGHDQLSVSNQEQGEEFKVKINWERITEAIDEEGHHNYTFSVNDFDENPKTFHNLVIGKNSDGSFKRPYLLSYEMSDNFWEKYLTTNSIAGFEGKVYKRYFPNNPLGTPRGNSSDPNDVDPRSTGDPCDRETNVGSNNGPSTPPSGSDPDPIDFGSGSLDCHGEWIDFASESCGPDCVTAPRSVYVIVCDERLNSSSDSDACNDDDGQVAVNAPEWDANVVLYEDPGEEIENLEEYLECFTTDAPATITVYIDQPVPGTDETYQRNGFDVDVGHTFISITQGNITRVMGFYPDGGVQPIINPGAQPLMVDDSGHEFTVSVSKNVPASGMNALLNAATSFSSNRYHLSRFNCTDYALKVANAAGLVLPDNSGSWPGGGGSNPGNLGEDVRSLPNNNDQTTDTNGGDAPANSGNCG